MNTSKIFFHIAAPCQGCSGIGAHWGALEAARIPFGIYAVNDAGLIAESTRYRHATLIYRDVEASTVNPADYAMSPQNAGLKYWQKQMFRLPAEIKALRNRVWIEIFNEPGKDDDQANWVGAVMATMARIALNEGYRIMGPGWSAGTPEPEHWLTPGWREYLQLCAVNPDRLAVSLHEYSLNDDIHHLEPWHIGRYGFLLKACDEIARPSIYITEAGWTLNSASVHMESDIEYLAGLYATRPEIKAAFLWTLQAGKGNGNLPERLNALISWLTQYTLDTRFPDPDPTPEPEPEPEPEQPMDKYKATVVLVPPRATRKQRLAIYAFQDKHGRTIARSFHDAVAVMPPHNPLASPESEIIVYGYGTLTADERAFLAAYNVRGTPLPDTGARS
jgi:hypothetical protein